MQHPLDPPGIVIGRGNEADLRINDPGVSRRHAEIRVARGRPRPAPRSASYDLGSTNGMLGQRQQGAAGQRSTTAARSRSATPP